MNIELSPREILYKSRIVFLFGEIDQQMADDIVPMLLVLNSLSSDPVYLYINSPGGQMTAGLAIYDTMHFIQAPVYTICIGQAASMAAWLLAAGSPGNRRASENAQIMIHQGRTVMGGTYSDLRVNMNEFSRNNSRMIKILARHTGKPEEQVSAAIERDCWMTSEEAKQFGIIDEVVMGEGNETHKNST